MKYIIYKLTNRTTNQIYFGYTSQLLKRRISGHKCEPRNTLISRSIRKYGLDNFLIENIKTLSDEKEAKDLEVYLIANNKTNHLRYPKNNGLNMTDGGEGAKGYKHSQKQRNKWKRQRKGQFAGEKHPAWGKFGSNNPTSKTIYVFDKETKKLIAEYGSIRDAAKALNVHPSNISKCCSDKYPTTHSLKGFTFSKSPV